jgi:hypothetical protein
MQKTGDGGTQDVKQRKKGQKQWNRDTEKGTLLKHLTGFRG